MTSRTGKEGAADDAYHLPADWQPIQDLTAMRGVGASTRFARREDMPVVSRSVEDVGRIDG